MATFHVKVGDESSFSKTVGETDVYSFAGITGDLAPNHVNEQYMRHSQYGTRIAHGALLVGYMSTASTLLCDRSRKEAIKETAVSLGYDRIRFIKGVRLGDTITVTYTIIEVDPNQRRTRAKVQVTNQQAETVAVAEHILKWVKNPEARVTKRTGGLVEPKQRR
jgi:3-hydroxybutyryl-CoA dehydratase